MQLDAATINALRDLGLGIIAVLVMAFVINRLSKAQETSDGTQATLVKLLARMEENGEKRDKQIDLIQVSMKDGVSASIKQVDAIKVGNTAIAAGNTKLDALIGATNNNVGLMGQIIEGFVHGTQDTTSAIATMTIELTEQAKELASGLSAEIAGAVAASQHTEAVVNTLPDRVWVTQEARDLVATLTAIDTRLGELGPAVNALVRNSGAINTSIDKLRDAIKPLLVLPLPALTAAVEPPAEHEPSTIAAQIINDAEARQI